jgi:hypothetical protein
VAPVAAKRELLQRQGGEAEEHPDTDRQRQEGDQAANIENAKSHGKRDPHVADQPDRRTEQLEDPEVRHREPPYRPVAWVSQHPPVAPEALGQAALPAPALTAEHGERLWGLGPRDGVGDELDPVGLAAAPQMLVDAHHQLGVLADRLRPPAADRVHDVAAEQVEGTRDDQQGPQPAPAHPADEEGAEVLDHLEHRDPRLGKPHLDDLPGLDPAAVGNPDDSACGDDAIGIVDDRPGDP